jgi:site-specific recombinase XerD
MNDNHDPNTGDALDTTSASSHFLENLEALDPDAFEALSADDIQEGQLAGRAFDDDTLVGHLLEHGTDPAQALSEHRRAAELAGGRDAPATHEAYAADLARWKAWCDARGIPPLADDPRVLCMYIAHLDHREFKTSSIERALAAVSRAYREFGMDSPARHPMVRGAIKALGRERRAGGETTTKARPLLVDDLADICATLGDHRLIDVRDRALLLVGYKLGARRSDLVGLQVEQLDWHTVDDVARLVVTLYQKKGDKHVTVPVTKGAPRPAVCAYSALEMWLRRAGHTEGPVFRPVGRWGHVRERALHPNSVNRIVGRLVERVDRLDPDHYSPHSLRRGLATEARRAGHPVHHIQQTTGHASIDQVAGYDHIDEVFERELLGRRS